MINITTILLALSLSLDAFSLSLAYGLMDKKSKVIVVSLLVGIFHFIMPLIGMNLGAIFIYHLPFDTKYIVSIIFLFILIEMVRSIKGEKEAFNLKGFNTILFAFFVSVDSFSIGIGLKYLTHYPIKACFTFALFSAFFTCFGFFLGKLISKKIEKVSKIIGIIILLGLIVYHLCK